MGWEAVERCKDSKSKSRWFPAAEVGSHSRFRRVGRGKGSRWRVLKGFA